MVVQISKIDPKSEEICLNLTVKREIINLQFTVNALELK